MYSSYGSQYLTCIWVYGLYFKLGDSIWHVLEHMDYGPNLMAVKSLHKLGYQKMHDNIICHHCFFEKRIWCSNDGMHVYVCVKVCVCHYVCVTVCLMLSLCMRYLKIEVMSALCINVNIGHIMFGGVQRSSGFSRGQTLYLYAFAHILS